MIVAVPVSFQIGFVFKNKTDAQGQYGQLDSQVGHQSDGHPERNLDENLMKRQIVGQSVEHMMDDSLHYYPIETQKTT